MPGCFKLILCINLPNHFINLQNERLYIHPFEICDHWRQDGIIVHIYVMGRLKCLRSLIVGDKVVLYMFEDVEF